MKRILTRKRVVFLAVLAVAAATAVGAFAYFTTTGSGTGTATVGTSTGLTITQTNTITGLTPGGGAMAVEYTIANTPASQGVQNLGKVTVSDIAVDETHATAGCLDTWFSTIEPSAAVGTIAAGATFTSAVASEPTIQMDNVGSSQDACKGATLTLTLSAAQGT